VLSVGFFLKNSDARLSDLWRIRGTDVDAYLRLARRAVPHRRLATGAGTSGPAA
jgi:hypothetical protein